MWKKDGTKLTGNYGTWNGQEIELWSIRPQNGTLTLVKDGGDSPGSDWHTQVLPNRFARTPFSHRRRVPSNEVTDIHSVRVLGELGPGRPVEIIAEDDKGCLAVVADGGFSMEEKMDLMEKYDFQTFMDSEPVGRQGVFGWIPAQMVHNIKSEVHQRSGSK
ncbi:MULTISPECIES: hypothetical protein [Arthrobacter]|uniref:hypothetical protein n=1 Tax=Arthrobacter TaxID=1663 RepID=UPI00128EABD0|nr:hypothetical protein [Arthrobacter sp. Edens01]